jgi:CHAD domain-containing protein
MGTPDLYRHFKIIIRQAKKKAKTALGTPEEEDLHQLRLSLKRLRAFYRFLELTNDEFIYKPYFKAWKKYFKHYGIIRNQQVMEKLAKEKISDLGLHIQVKSVPVKGSAPAQIKKKLINKSRKKVKVITADLHKKHLKKYLHHELFRIESILKQTDAERYKQLHELRKILKDMHYNKEFLKGYNKTIDRKSFAAWMEEMMQYLGEWLDTGMLIQNLNEQDNLKFSAHNDTEIELLKDDLVSAYVKQRVVIMAMCNRGQLLIEPDMKAISI